jgi:hypothetical protein
VNRNSVEQGQVQFFLGLWLLARPGQGCSAGAALVPVVQIRKSCVSSPGLVGTGGYLLAVALVGQRQTRLRSLRAHANVPGATCSSCGY